MASFKKKFIVVFVAFIALLAFVYHSHSFYKRFSQLPYPLNPYFISLVDNVIHEFDLSRAVGLETLSDDNYIDLIFSGDDLNHISSSIELFIDEGYIRDQSNPWRKAKVVINGKREKVKYKFHGTSVTPLKSDFSFFVGLVMKKFGLIDSHIVPSVNSGVFSLKIKHKKEGKYYDLMRRYKLISHHDDAEISTIVMNKIASNLGLMAPYGEMVILRINGAEIGAYMLVEAHNKEWFEREHQLTNYTIFKSNDDWDRKGGHSHASGTDLNMANKKVSSISQYSPIALGSLELLLTAIKNNDINQIKKLLDINYMAQYMALLSITNNNHPIAGDNLRYIYNHATGKFKILFRLEDGILENTQSIGEFNRSLFITPYQDLETFSLFKILLTDPDFLVKRDERLHAIVKNKSKWRKLIKTTVAKNMKVLLGSNEPIRPIKFKVKQFKNFFENNIEKARQYLEYNKIFVTKYTDITGKKSLRIVNDFVHPIALKLSSKDNSSSKSIQLDPLRIDANQQVVYKEQEVNIDNVEQLIFENLITHSDILKRHIYFNEAIERLPISNRRSLQMLDKNNINYKADHKNRVITLQPGKYYIDSNIITPYGYKIVVQAGVELFLDKGISFLVRGGLGIYGTELKPVIITRKQNNASFGVFAVSGESKLNTKVFINYLKFDGGSEAVVNGTLFTGQMTINSANVVIKNSSFQNSLSDDGINIKYSKVEISRSIFTNNFGDQIDLDYCQASVNNSIFSYQRAGRVPVSFSTDGLDISGSVVSAFDNTFSNLSDKGISVGEKSKIFIGDNIFNNNNLAIAVKDNSKAFVDKNIFESNKIDISMYIKKKMYKEPELYTTSANRLLNFNVREGSVIFSDNLNKEFEALRE